jgi:tetratricopeptide (TPR) repeat protein
VPTTLKRFILVCLALLALWSFSSAAQAFQDPLELENVEPFRPKQTGDDASTRLREAEAMFSAARALAQAEDFSGALRMYQRALRYDPQSLPILQEIVQLAFSLGRPSEAVRYALKAIDMGTGDPVLLRRLAVQLTSQGDFEGALKLYEKALEMQGEKRDTPAALTLLVEMGELYLANEQAEQAANAFAQVRDALENPDAAGLDKRQRKLLLGDAPHETYQRFAQAFLLADRFDEAEAAFRKSNELRADAALLAFGLAQVQARRKQPAEALKALDEYFATKQDELGTAPYELLAEQLEAAGQFDQLLTKLEALRADQSGSLSLGYFLADQYLKAQRWDDAEKLFTELMEKKPVAEGFQGLAQVALKKQRAKQLFELFGKCVEEGGGLGTFGEVLEAVTKDPTLCNQIFATGRERAASEEGILYSQALGLGLFALECKNWDAAAEFFPKAIDAKPGDAVPVYLQWGFGLLVDDQYAEAADVFQKAIDDQRVPKDEPDFYFHLAGALEMTDRTDQALEASKKATELADLHAERLGDKVFRIYPRTAWILYHAKRYDEARQSYEELVKRFDSVRTSSEAREAVRDARFVLSNLCVQQKRLDEAEEWLEQILDEYPEDVGAYNDLGYLWADRNKNLDRALEMIRVAIEAQPDNIAYRDSLGWVLFRLGKYDEAAAELERATQGDDPDGVILDHLADCYAQMGRTEDAKKTYERAIQAMEAKGEAEALAATRAKLEQLSK